MKIRQNIDRRQNKEKERNQLARALPNEQADADGEADQNPQRPE